MKKVKVSRSPAEELVCFKQPFGNFQRKHLLGSSVSVKLQVIRTIELEKSTCEWLFQKVGILEGLFLVRLSFYVSFKAFDFNLTFQWIITVWKMRVKKITVHYYICRSRSHNAYKSTLEAPEQGAEYFQN